MRVIHDVKASDHDSLLPRTINFAGSDAYVERFGEWYGNSAVMVFIGRGVAVVCRQDGYSQDIYDKSSIKQDVADFIRENA